MKSILIRAAGVAAGVAWAAAGGGCVSSSVPNPVFAAWAGFEPGSSVTLVGTQKTAPDAAPLAVRITHRLLDKTADRVVVERTVATTGTDRPLPPVVTTRAEPRMIDPLAHHRTWPNAHVADLGRQDVVVNGQVIDCRVTEVRITAAFGGLFPSQEEYQLRTWTSPQVPSGTVKLLLIDKSAHLYREVSAQAVEFQAIRGNKP